MKLTKTNLQIHISPYNHKKGNSSYEDYYDNLQESIVKYPDQHSHVCFHTLFDGSLPNASWHNYNGEGLNLNDETIQLFSQSFIDTFSHIKEPGANQDYAFLNFIINCWTIENGKVISDMDGKKSKQYAVSLLPTHGNAISVRRIDPSGGEDKILFNKSPNPR